MKVILLLPALEQGGVETVVCDLVRELDGCESVVISKGGRLVGKIVTAGGRHIALDLKSKNPLTYFTRAWKLRRILRLEKPDLVCVHSRVPAWLFVWANRALGLKWISYAHGANSVSRYSEVMTKGDLVITPSRFLADYLKANYGTPEEKIRVIPNAVDTKRFDPENLDRAFVAEKRREWGIREGDRVLMAIGRITPVKGLDNLIRTMPSDVKLVIVGGADKHHQQYLESLKKLASTVHLHLSPSPIVFAGPQEKIPECISIAEEIVSANTTKPETFGLSVIEAYAMNKPVRAKRFGGVAEVMEAVEKADKPTLREAVMSLYGVERQRERTLVAYREALDMV
ncbi:MAG: glycosyltransferase [bacterium]|nr:glycosyltransferase [Candidatus Colisoma equi]